MTAATSLRRGLREAQRRYWWKGERKRTEAAARCLDELDSYQAFQPAVAVAKTNNPEGSLEKMQATLRFLDEHFAAFVVGAAYPTAALALELGVTTAQSEETLELLPDSAWKCWAQEVGGGQAALRAIRETSRGEWNADGLGRATLELSDRLTPQQLNRGLDRWKEQSFQDWSEFVQGLTAGAEQKTHLRAQFLCLEQNELADLAQLGSQLNRADSASLLERCQNLAKDARSHLWLEGLRELDEPQAALKACQGGVPTTFQEGVTQLEPLLESTSMEQPEKARALTSVLAPLFPSKEAALWLQLAPFFSEMAPWANSVRESSLEEAVAELPDERLPQGCRLLAEGFPAAGAILEQYGPEAARLALRQRGEGRPWHQTVESLYDSLPPDQRRPFAIDQATTPGAEGFQSLEVTYPVELDSALLAGDRLAAFRELSQPEEAIQLARVYLEPRGLMLDCEGLDRWSRYRVARVCLETAVRQPNTELARVEAAVEALQQIRGLDARLQFRRSLQHQIPVLKQADPEDDDAFQRSLEAAQLGYSQGLLGGAQQDEWELSIQTDEVQLGPVTVPRWD